MTVTIRINISATVKGSLLFGDLNIEFTDAVKRLLDTKKYSIHKLGTGFECYLYTIKETNPDDINDYVEDRLDSILDWIKDSRYYDLFIVGLVTIDVNKTRFQYEAQYVDSGKFKWVSF